MRACARTLALSIGLFGLTACSSGGGSGGGTSTAPQTAPSSASSPTSNSAPSGAASSQTASSSTPTGSSSGSQTTPSSQSSSSSATVIGAPVAATISGSFPTASGSTPNFSSSLPSNGTSFPLLQAELSVSGGSATGQSFANGATLTITGTQLFGAANQPIYELKIPDLGVDATPLQGNGATVTLSDGRTLTFSLLNLNYSLFGAWSLSPQTAGGSASNLGIGISGYQTPTSGIPTGTATYTSSTNGVGGFAVTPSATGSLAGQANIGVNFSTGVISGSLTNMKVTPSGGSAAAWNSVNLSGSLSGSTLSGTTASGASPPAGTMSFDASSSGTFNGALFGPNGQELGAVWSLHDPTGQGKSAIGYIGATKQ